MELDLSARSADIILEFCTWGTNSEMRPRANHCLWHSSEWYSFKKINVEYERCNLLNFVLGILTQR